MKEIPKEISSIIYEESAKRYATKLIDDLQDFESGAEYGYQLATDGREELEKVIESHAYALDGYVKKAEELEKENERLKGLIADNYKYWFVVFYRNTSQMTAREISDYHKEEWEKFKSKNNL